MGCSSKNQLDVGHEVDPGFDGSILVDRPANGNDHGKQVRSYMNDKIKLAN